MRIICVFLLLAITPLSTHATVLPAAPEPDHTDEAIGIMVGTLATLGNVMMIAEKSPAYWVGGLGVASGVAALIMRGQSDVEHENGLMAVGLLSAATGAIALRYRYVLDHDKTQARLEPTWHAGSPGLALVVDF